MGRYLPCEAEDGWRQACPNPNPRNRTALSFGRKKQVQSFIYKRDMYVWLCLEYSYVYWVTPMVRSSSWLVEKTWTNSSNTVAVREMLVHQISSLKNASARVIYIVVRQQDKFLSLVVPYATMGDNSQLSTISARLWYQAGPKKLMSIPTLLTRTYRLILS